MLRLLLVVSISLITLLGCAHEESHPSPYFASEVVTVPENRWYAYWRYATNPTYGLPSSPKNGCMSMQFTIDSNGKVYDPKLLALQGSTNMYQGMLSYLKDLRFKPAPDNQARVPVRTVFTWSYGTSTAKATEAEAACHPSPEDASGQGAVSGL